MKNDKVINANCGVCGNCSGYDEESLKGSTYKINGLDVVLCCPCEDDLKKRLNSDEIKRLKEFVKDYDHILMSEDILTLNTIISNLSGEYN